MNRIKIAKRPSRYTKLISQPYDFDKSETGLVVEEDNDMPFYHLSLPIIAENVGTIGHLRLSITKEFIIATLESLKQKIYLLPFRKSKIFALNSKKRKSSFTF